MSFIKTCCLYHTPPKTRVSLYLLPTTVPAAPAAAKPFDALQDSQLFDAENSEPLSATGGGFSSSQDRPRNGEAFERKRAAASPRLRHKPRGTEGSVLYGVMFVGGGRELSSCFCFVMSR